MVPTLVAAVAGLVGLLVGRLWDLRSEERRWRRDQRVRTYEQLAGAYYAVREAIRDVALLEPNTDAAQDAAARALDRGVEWNRTVVAVWLHGSSRVTKALRELDYEVDELFLSARSKKYTWDEWRVRRQVAERKLEEFIAAVRQELELPHLTVSVRARNLTGKPRDPY